MSAKESSVFQATGVVVCWFVSTSKKTDLDIYFRNSVGRSQSIGLVIVAGSVCVVGEVVPLGRELIQEEIWC